MFPRGTPGPNRLSRYGGFLRALTGTACKMSPRVRHDLTVTVLARLVLRPFSTSCLRPSISRLIQATGT
jgi:hypothetical protein